MDEHTKVLTDCKAKLRAESHALTQRKEALQSTIVDDTQWIDENEGHKVEDMDIDRLLLPSDQWSEQCMAETAHCTAIHDEILQMDSYLEDERFPLDQYLKQISKLGREQFPKMATALKVQALQQDLVNGHTQMDSQRRRRSMGSAGNGLQCAVCGETATLRCSRCKKRYYCSSGHQTQDWAAHNQTCTTRNEGFGNRHSR